MDYPKPIPFDFGNPTPALTTDFYLFSQSTLRK